LIEGSFAPGFHWVGTGVGPFPRDGGRTLPPQPAVTPAVKDASGLAKESPAESQGSSGCVGILALCEAQNSSEASSSNPDNSEPAPLSWLATVENEAGENSGNEGATKRIRRPKPPDFNREIYYRNKLEFGLDFGVLPINIPFPLDVFVGDNYNTYPLRYTLAPIFASLRWHIDGIEGPWILRGNWDMTFTGGATLIIKGPESRYLAYIMGIRRNFVPRNSRLAPYFDIRLGVGNTDAQGPLGVAYAQGQDWTFTVNMGSGVRYNFSPRYAFSAGLHFMHMSNLDLSEHPWTPQNPTYGVRNYGINVVGPMVGIDVQLRRHRHSDQ
jgi:hypothetical protein